mgnify:CR=1 FL=1
MPQLYSLTATEMRRVQELLAAKKEAERRLADVAEAEAASARAARISERWPAWKYPMVGTKPTRPPIARVSSQRERSSWTRVTVFT